MKKEDLINEVMENKKKEYKVGQRVKVISGANVEEYNGKEGIIYNIDLESITQPNITVRFENNHNIWCYSSDGYDFNVEILEDDKYQVGDLVCLESGIISTIISIDNTKEIKTANVIDGSRKDVYTINQSFIVSHVKPLKELDNNQKQMENMFDGKKHDLLFADELLQFELPKNNKLIRRFPTELWDNEAVVNDNGLKYIKRDGVRVFETGSVRSLNDGRERYDLIPQLALDVAAKIFGKNIGQFGSGNHIEHCIPEKACLESLKRHLAAYTRSLEGYEDTNEDDAGSILTNALMLVHTIEMKKIGLYKIKYGKDI